MLWAGRLSLSNTENEDELIHLISHHGGGLERGWLCGILEIEIMEEV